MLARFARVLKVSPRLKILDPPMRGVVGVSVDAVCRNGGTCRDVGESHRCQCRAGFDGSYCSHDVDECRSQPCRNGARCVDLVARYHCDCPLGFQVCLCSAALLDFDSNFARSTRSSAIAEGPRDASCQLKSCQLPRNSAESTCTTSPEPHISCR